MKSALVPIEKLKEEPYASILCYPRASNSELRKRLRELQRLDVKAIEFHGKKQVFNVPVLGKGCVGIVTIAYVNSEKIAMKIRRVDADRSGLRQEAKMLSKANSARVGPKLLAVSKNFLMMQFIDGDLLPEWLERHRAKRRIRRVLRDVLEQCRRLDELGLDHGELSHAPKHLIIDKHEKPFIVDFETASISRKPSNVTSVCQFLFIGSAVAKIIAEKLGEKDRQLFIQALRFYKIKRTRENFRRILKLCLL